MREVVWNILKLPCNCCPLVLMERLVFKQAFALIVFSDGLKNETQRTEQQFQACKNRFGNDFRLWLAMVLHNWLSNSQLYCDPSSFPTYSVIFLAINHLLSKIDGFNLSCEHGSVFNLLLTMHQVLGSILNHKITNLSYSNNLVNIRVVLEVFRHAKSESNLYSVLSLFLKEVLVILCWNPWQLFQGSETRHVFGWN